jgi:hypothetical protein
MTAKVLTATLALVLGACTAVPPESSENTSSQKGNGDDETVAATPAAFRGGALPAASACVGDVNCPPQFVCPDDPTFDSDCGDPFCRTPGAQCGGQLSLFTRVEHFYVCEDGAGRQCVAARQGRRLISCGC